MPIFVPLVTVNVQPAKNADRPAIELTTRSCQCPPYEVALVKAVWGRMHAENITVEQMPDHVNPLWELVPRDGKNAMESEILRLTRKYGRMYAPGTKTIVFDMVYREGELEAAINKCSKDANVFVEQAAVQEAERQAEGATKAAEALMKASGQAVARAKAGPGRPRKNPPFKNPEEAPALSHL